MTKLFFKHASILSCLGLMMGLASCQRNQTHAVPDVTKATKIRLTKLAGQGNIHAARVRVEGELDGKAAVKLVHPGEKSPRVLPLKGGTFSLEIYKGDWYVDSMDLEYLPENVTRGQVRFVYHFSG